MMPILAASVVDVAAALAILPTVNPKTALMNRYIRYQPTACFVVR